MTGPSISFGGREFAPPGVFIVGVLNVTPDSFSDGGRYLDPAAGVEHAFRLAAEGADLLDVGGESTAISTSMAPGPARPNRSPVKSMRASSRSPSPITTSPATSSSSNAPRIASMAA